MDTIGQKQTVLRLISILCVGAGFVTAIPFAAASEASILGYKAVCPFAPISTIIVVFVGATIYRYLVNANKQV